MPKLVTSFPTYRKHRAIGLALVTINGKDHYLGPHGTKTSKLEYDRIINQSIASSRNLMFGLPSKQCGEELLGEPVLRRLETVSSEHHGRSQAEARRILDAVPAEVVEQTMAKIPVVVVENLCDDFLQRHSPTIVSLGCGNGTPCDRGRVALGRHDSRCHDDLASFIGTDGLFLRGNPTPGAAFFAPIASVSRMLTIGQHDCLVLFPT